MNQRWNEVNTHVVTLCGSSMSMSISSLVASVTELVCEVKRLPLPTGNTLFKLTASRSDSFDDVRSLRRKRSSDGTDVCLSRKVFANRCPSPPRNFEERISSRRCSGLHFINRKLRRNLNRVQLNLKRPPPSSNSFKLPPPLSLSLSLSHCLFLWKNFSWKMLSDVWLRHFLRYLMTVSELRFYAARNFRVFLQSVLLDTRPIGRNTVESKVFSRLYIGK